MLRDAERRPADGDPPELPRVEPEPLVADRLDHQRAGTAALILHPHHAPRAPKPGQRPADPLDKVRTPIDPMLAGYMASELGVTWPMGDYRGSAPGANAWTWSGTLGPGGPFLDYDYQARVSEAFRANPKFRLMIGTGYYDLTTTIGPARYLVSQSDWPRERVVQRQYVGGHMAYTVAASHKAFTDDIRALVGAPRAA